MHRQNFVCWLIQIREDSTRDGQQSAHEPKTDATISLRKHTVSLVDLEGLKQFDATAAERTQREQLPIVDSHGKGFTK